MAVNPTDLLRHPLQRRLGSVHRGGVACAFGVADLVGSPAERPCEIVPARRRERAELSAIAFEDIGEQSGPPAFEREQRLACPARPHQRDRCVGVDADARAEDDLAVLASELSSIHPVVRGHGSLRSGGRRGPVAFLGRPGCPGRSRPAGRGGVLLLACKGRVGVACRRGGTVLGCAGASRPQGQRFGQGEQEVGPLGGAAAGALGRIGYSGKRGVQIGVCAEYGEAGGESAPEHVLDARPVDRPRV